MDAYKAHIETPHFKKYKTGTEAMVKSLKLVETDPVCSARSESEMKRAMSEKQNTE